MLFFVFAVMLFAVMLLFWCFGHFRYVLYKTMNIAANLKNIAYRRLIVIPPNSTVTVMAADGKIETINIQENSGVGTGAEIVLSGGTGCLYLVTENFSRAYTICGSGMVSPGTYYMQYMPVESVGLYVETFYSWLPFVLVVALIVTLMIMFAWIKER